MVRVAMVTLVASAATIVGMLISVGVMVYKITSWKSQTEADHEEMKEAHYNVHDDIEKLIDEVNGMETSSIENCDVCQEVKQNRSD